MESDKLLTTFFKTSFQQGYLIGPTNCQKPFHPIINGKQNHFINIIPSTEDMKKSLNSKASKDPCWWFSTFVLGVDNRSCFPKLYFIYYILNSSIQASVFLYFILFLKGLHQHSQRQAEINTSSTWSIIKVYIGMFKVLRKK